MVVRPARPPRNKPEILESLSEEMPPSLSPASSRLARPASVSSPLPTLSHLVSHTAHPHPLLASSLVSSLASSLILSHLRLTHISRVTRLVSFLSSHTSHRQRAAQLSPDRSNQRLQDFQKARRFRLDKILRKWQQSIQTSTTSTGAAAATHTHATGQCPISLRTSRLPSPLRLPFSPIVYPLVSRVRGRVCSRSGRIRV